MTTIQLQYSVDIAKASNAIDAMKAKLDQLKAAQEKAFAAGDTNTEAYDKLTKSIDLLEKETTLASNKLGDLKEAAQAASLNPLADSAANAETSLKKLRLEQDSLLSRIEKETNPAALKKLKEEYAANERQIEKTKNKIGDFSDKLRTLDGSKVERIRASFGLVQEGLLNLDFDKVKTGIGGATQAFGGLGKAIIATGIGAIVVAVGLLIANFDKLKNFIPGLGAAFEFIGDIIGNVKDGILAFTDAIGLTDSKTASATEKILSDRERLKKDLDFQEKEAIENARKNGEDTQKVVDEYRNKRIKASQDVIDQLEKQKQSSKVLSDKMEKTYQDEIDAIREINIEAQKQANDAADEAKKKAEEEAKEAEQRRKEAADKAKAAADKLRQEQKAAREATNKELNDLEVAAIKDADERNKRQLSDALKAKEDEIEGRRKLFAKDKEAQAAIDQELLLLRQKFDADVAAIDAAANERKRQRAVAVAQDNAQFEREQARFAGEQLLSELERRISEEQRIRQSAIDDETDPVKRAQLELENVRKTNEEALTIIRARFAEQIAETQRAQQALIDAEVVKRDNTLNDPAATAEQKLQAEEDFQREKNQILANGANQELLINQQVNDAIKEQNDKANQDEIDGFTAVQQAKLQKAQDTLGQISQGLQGLSDFAASLGQIESNRLDNEYAKKLAGAKGNADLTAKIQEELEKKKEELRKKEFKRNKAFQLANAAIAGAQAVLQALASPPGPPATIPFAIGAGVVAAAQIAAIASKKYEGSESVPPPPPPPPPPTEDNPPSASNAQPLQFAQATQAQQAGSVVQAQPARVYVVESDIQSVQEQRERRDDKATVIQ